MEQTNKEKHRRQIAVIVPVYHSPQATALSILPPRHLITTQIEQASTIQIQLTIEGN